MIFNHTTQISQTAHQFQEILAQVLQRDGVVSAVLSTVDGLSLAHSSNAGHMAAMTGFLFASIRQATAMMSWKACQEVTLQLADGVSLVGKVFEVQGTPLFLTVVFNKKVAYERFLKKIIEQIQITVEG